MAASARPDTEDSDAIIAEINITPLTDVFLVLLIIFMVTSSVIANTGKKVDLPEAVQQSQTPPKAVNVTITEAGVVQVNDQVVKLEQLRGHLEKALAATENKTVILRGDRKVVLEQAVYVLDQAQLAGAEGFALATKKPKKKS
jgi:biopolymer transport protein ExbD